MEMIRSWVMGITAAAIIGAVVLALNPSGAAEKSVKTIVAVFLISSMILPFVKSENLNFDFDSASVDTARQNEKIVNSVSEQFKEKLENSITDILSQNGIEVARINIDMNVKTDEVSVEKISITLKKESADKADEAKNILKEQLSVTAQITTEG